MVSTRSSFFYFYVLPFVSFKHKQEGKKSKRVRSPIMGQSCSSQVL